MKNLIIKEYEPIMVPEEGKKIIIPNNIIRITEPGEGKALNFASMNAQQIADGDIMQISDLQRCIGIIIALTKNDLKILDGAFGFHIPPYDNVHCLLRKLYGNFIKDIAKSFKIKAIGIAGGKINNEINRCYYQRSLTEFFYPIASLLEDEDIQYVQFSPQDRTEETLMSMRYNKISAVHDIGGEYNYAVHVL